MAEGALLPSYTTLTGAWVLDVTRCVMLAARHPPPPQNPGLRPLLLVCVLSSVVLKPSRGWHEWVTSVRSQVSPLDTRTHVLDFCCITSCCVLLSLTPTSRSFPTVDGPQNMWRLSSPGAC